MTGSGAAKRRDDASAQLVAILLGVALFAGVVAFALTFADKDNHVTRESSADFAAKAEALVLRLLATPGVPSDWETLTEGEIKLLGLASNVETPFLVDAAKLDRFRGADRPANDRIANLTGLIGYGVHLRLEPSLGLTPNGTVGTFAAEPVAYVAHRSGSVSATKRATADTVPALAEETYLRELGFPFRPMTASELDHASAGDVHPDSTLDLARELVPRLAGFESVSYSAAAPAEGTWKVVRKGEYGSASWWTTGTPERLFTTGDYSTILGAFVPTVQEHSVSLPLIDLSDRAEDWDTTLTITHWFDAGQPTPLPDLASVLVECVSNCSSVGESTVWSSSIDVGSRSTPMDTLIDLSEHNGEVLRARLHFDRNSLVTRGAMEGEGWFISRLRVESERGSDVVSLYENDLDYNTTSYRALLVGSDVDHAAFLASDRVVLTALTDWLVAGGRMVVLGSASADQSWLESTFATSGTPVSASALFADASDLTHPLVSSPRSLRVTSLNWSAPAYRPTGDFVTVLRGEDEMAPGVRTPLLSATQASGRFSGAVVLATARPGLDDEPEVAKAALVNWLAYALHAEGYADLGDSVPSKLGFGYSDGALILHDAERGTSWPATVTSFVWR